MKHLFLIGFMGCGKSSVAKRLSYSLKRPLMELDRMVESAAGKSITEIFAGEGEEAFREMETQQLKKLFDTKQGYVVSTGGGLPLREKNRRIMKKQGVVVYLRATPQTLYERVKYDTKRPLLQVEDPMERIRELLSQRSSIYEEAADCIVDVDNLGLSEVASLVQQAYEKEKQRRREEKSTRVYTMPRFLVIHGPNLNFLGIREPEIYGTRTYQDLMEFIRRKAVEHRVYVEFYQSNHEGDLIDRIQKSYMDGTRGIIINPGALTHYSYALHDALASIDRIPKIEVHLSDITKREGFRAVSVTKDACQGQIYGKGFDGYTEAMELLLELVN